MVDARIGVALTNYDSQIMAPRHRENRDDNKSLREEINGINSKLSRWGGGLAVIGIVLGVLMHFWK